MSGRDDKAMRADLQRRLNFLIGALPEGMTFTDWYSDHSAQLEVLTEEAGEDWIVESVSHSWGYIEGVAVAHDMTALELLDEYGVVYEQPDTQTAADVVKVRAKARKRPSVRATR